MPAPSAAAGSLQPERTQFMPHLIVKLAKGRSDTVKQELAGRLTATMMDVLGHGADAVSVAMEEVPMEDWMEQVYGPDIEAAASRLLKRPGYGPLALTLDDEG